MQIFWSKTATSDLLSLFNYIQRDSPQNAALVVSRIVQAIDLLGSSPFLGTPVHGDHRMYSVPRTGFRIMYKLYRHRLHLTSIRRATRKD